MIHTWFRQHFVRSIAGALLVLFVTSVFPGQNARGQTGSDLAAVKQQADQLISAEKFTEALPLIERVLTAEPGNAHFQFNLGFALIGQGTVTKEPAERKAIRIRARNAFIKARDLGEKAPVLDAVIEGLPADGSDTNGFSPNAQVNDLMNGAEALFSQGKLDEALLGYQRALELEPKLYYAALFCGDVFTQKGDFPSAEIWYQKAIAIDPNRETAYRYSATPLMKQQKYELARDRYIEAFIAEPFSKFSVAGLNQWSQVTKTPIANPNVDIPVEVKIDDKGEMQINMTANMSGGGNDGVGAWILYGGTRIEWHKQKFAATFPSEKVYRHSLAEESDALRSVISMATSDKKVKVLNASLAKLKQLNDAGLLESYILLARADDGIAQDYPAYRDKNRDKLRRYVLLYVMAA